MDELAESKHSETNPRIAFLGKTGAGKSSLINSLFGLHLETGTAMAVTKRLHPEPVTLDGTPVEVIDTPGFAESQQTEAEYLELYQGLLPTVTHIVWVVQSHPRVFRPDQEALISLADVMPGGEHRVTVALTRADSIGPGGWDAAAARPSAGQLRSLSEQSQNVLDKFSPYLPSLALDDIVPCAPTAGYGLNSLTSRIVSALLAADGPAEPVPAAAHPTPATQG